ncbi:hypothetical protein KUL25_02685 [Rhodobacteraceae bacterium N5(2021)]|uniref:YrhK domain-containing protein n=1 Tax=Gymnodinialimonas phycosphaerae TaxID=2841589 RepID=A0ABS7MNN1_9RHOB|nr:hypothetical protein [Gymnodinialimonas phycosphaerae]MBY4891667.1 hypothetical protein [Gymnodinialimonas phycosphaerae]
MPPRRRDPLATHNERVRLRSNFLNALSIGFLGFAFLRPLVDGTLILNVLTLAFLVTGVVLHGVAHYILRYLETED